jgi:cytochrome oxidase Cu insertion factor (SCO1/SenC/PrrC family)
LQFAARRNPATGLVDHANLFILIDANGRIAYRFNLDQRHRSWLIAAVESLTDEAIEGRP